MEDQYGLPDFRQLMATRTDQVPSNPHFPGEPFPSLPRNLISSSAQPQPPIPHNNFQSYPLASSGFLEFGCHDPYTSVASTPAASGSLYGIDKVESAWNFNENEGQNSNSRWPRQETLTLLEIRSRLNSKFKDTNQKGPLWDEVSRIMGEEHGYQRSGKKCKEKFENLYKYYKKTKEGKAGRQDGRNYRFFRQLEAIYGETSNQSSPLEAQNHGKSSPLGNNSIRTPNYHDSQEVVQDHKLCESLSFSNNSTEFETSSSENNEDDLSAVGFKMNHYQKLKGINGRSQSCPRSKKSWKTKVEDFVDSQMRKIMVTQETWMEKMMKSVIDKEDERLAKEEERRKQDTARFDQRVNEFWAKEKAWVEARDAALMETLKKSTGKGVELPCLPERMIGNDIPNDTTFRRLWSEQEIASLIQIRSSLEMAMSFQGNVYLKDDELWENIAAKMACFGYDRTSIEVKEKWEKDRILVGKKGGKEDLESTSTNTGYFEHQLFEQPKGILKQDHERIMGLQLMDERLTPSSSNAGSQVQPNCFHILFGGGENSWENKFGGKAQ
ncbi:hypothetical protein UlMin_026127 [Ulmus minor]